MPSFKDEEGRDWRVRIDVGAVQRVLDLNIDPPVNLGDLGEAADSMVRFSDDPVLLCNVLYLICEPQIKERGTSEIEFGSLFMGDILYDAAMALEEAITTFFPPAKRSLLQRLRKKIARVREAGTDLVSENLEDKNLEAKILANMQAKMKAMINQGLTLSNSPSNSEE